MTSSSATTAEDPRNDTLLCNLIHWTVQERWPGATWVIADSRWDSVREITMLQVRVQPQLDYVEISFTLDLDDC
jgi:hypothetical protein